MLKLREELLAAEEERLAGRAGVTPDECYSFPISNTGAVSVSGSRVYPARCVRCNRFLINFCHIQNDTEKGRKSQQFAASFLFIFLTLGYLVLYFLMKVLFILLIEIYPVLQCLLSMILLGMVRF